MTDPLLTTMHLPNVSPRYSDQAGHIVSNGNSTGVLPGEVLGVVVLVGTEVLVEGVDGAHVLGLELEGEDLEVLGKVVGLGARDGDEAALDDPAKDDLRRGLLVALGEALDDGIAHDVDVALPERSPG